MGKKGKKKDKSTKTYVQGMIIGLTAGIMVSLTNNLNLGKYPFFSLQYLIGFIMQFLALAIILIGGHWVYRRYYKRK